MKRVGFNLEEGQTSAPLKKSTAQKGSTEGKSGAGDDVLDASDVSKKKIFDPQDTFLQFWNKIFMISCFLSISCDPLFFYPPFVHEEGTCLGVDKSIAITVMVVRTLLDAFYIFRMVLQFRTSFVVPSPQVFGRWELVRDAELISEHYMKGRWFIIDVLSILPLPQFATWRYLHVQISMSNTQTALLLIVFLQYIPRISRIFPLASELKRTVGVIADSAIAGAAFYLFLYLLSGHIFGALWYFLAVQRNVNCWEKSCDATPFYCTQSHLYCNSQKSIGRFHYVWRNMSDSVLKKACSVENEGNPSPDIIKFGIYKSAVEDGIFSEKDFLSKYFYCLWWGLRNLSTLGQGLQTSLHPGEVAFAIAIAVFGLILFGLLIGNMQTYIQSITHGIDEMRIKWQDSEQWMNHRALPQDLRERVRRYDEYRWVENRGIDEQTLVRSLPEDLRRDIKRHLCLALVKKVPLFSNMDDQLLDAICERLQTNFYIEDSFVMREGDPVEEMLFIIHGRLESVTTDGGRIGFFNQSILNEGDFCGDELLSWALDPNTGFNLPSSTRTVVALSDVEAFALSADDIRFVTGQFRRLHSVRFQQVFRYYSHRWRTWAACLIQAYWRRYMNRKMIRNRQQVQGEILEGTIGASSSIGATMYASRFATNALRGVRYRNTRSARELVQLQKPPEPDFSVEETDDID